MKMFYLVRYIIRKKIPSYNIDLEYHVLVIIIFNYVGMDEENIKI